MPDAPYSTPRQMPTRRPAPVGTDNYMDNVFTTNELTTETQQSDPSTLTRDTDVLRRRLASQQQPQRQRPISQIFQPPSCLLDSANTTVSPTGEKLNSTMPDKEILCPYGCCKSETTSEYIFRRGFLEGVYSDVVIEAFGSRYRLHKLFLDKSDYFRSLFKWSSTNRMGNGDDDDDDDDDEAEDSEDDNGIGSKSSNDGFNGTTQKKTRKKVYQVQDVFELEFDDSRITQSSFELAIARLYGAINIKEENTIPYNMIAIGQYLALSSVVCTATYHIIKNMSMKTISENLKFASSNNYGSASERIIQNGKGLLCSEGWEVGVEKWDEIPIQLIAEVVGENYFFVPTEWDRCMFIIKLLERRLETMANDDTPTPDVSQIHLLKNVLNEKIHYCHLSPEQLQELESYLDINGEPYVDPQILHKALWQAVQLQRLVVTSMSSPNLANVITSAAPPSADSKWFRVPIKDVTLAGLPTEIDRLMLDTLSSTTQSVNLENGKSTQDDTLDIPDRMYSWSKIPPFRFSIAFANVSDLLTEKRVYGKTFWYAGSYWNLYLQKNHIHSKNTYQIGVYLHRASSSSNPSSKHGYTNPDLFANSVNYHSLPKKNTPPSHLSTSTRDILQTNESSLLDREEKANVQDDTGLNFYDLSLSETRYYPDRMNFDSGSTSSYNNNSSAGGIRTSADSSTIAGSNNVEDRSFLTYEDQRNVIKVYFIIFTPSRRDKPTITSFLSVPNDFHKSQSWGWKSNSMCVFNEDGTFPVGHDPHLKFMIVLGNV
ncbi:hypothetical protein CANARDRAFT_28873 [[Candida] arabinofermentans NRRL YB-2248]|uniref:BTB domain-containing protein n=1 Tax=[Candida] arabinofermentans NRRL YB-2248 TaxID=983967 RepID=A0A1E4SZ15_9ASCO|nr:hypothetical protein CANARDRAFT_28873 [[Candida] arabinofermentans NRRL YB-2248]